MEIHDIIIVGSGCTGAMAAQTLVEKGERVLMIDGGITEDHYQELQPKKNFSDIRKEDQQQSEYFLGDHFESIPENSLGTGAQLTPARQFLIAETEKYLPLISESFQPMESLALGGLGGGWGLGCCVFSENELKQAGLDPSAMKNAYQVIADRIGICSEKDDARKFTGAYLEGLQTPPSPGETAKVLLNNYSAKKSTLNQSGFFLGRPALALLTSDRNGRKATALRDMDFYDDSDRSAYRPAFTIDELKKKNNFQYEGGWLVTKFEEKENAIEVTAIRIGTNEERMFFCRRLILAPGVLGTARIVLRSVKGGMNAKLPLLCNPYTYLPCVVTSRLGKTFPQNESGFAQLSLFHDADGTESDIAMASLYTYRSLLLFRLLRETPLNFRDGRIFMKHLLPALLIAGIHHPEKMNGKNSVQLSSDPSSITGDKLKCDYVNAFDEKVIAREKKFRSALKKLGARALKTVHPAIGASIHYAGVLPFGETGNAFHLHPSGRLHGTKNVFVADGSGFSFLPAKGLTLSLMANAHNVAQNVMQK
ncbi:MAG TPA: GMC oxidoreductase [Bacteroidia bacterium]|nr:GMC oxidoreductase [Bacteroidia bacterium]